MMKILETGEVDLESIILSYVYSEIEDGRVRCDIQAYFFMNPVEGDDYIAPIYQEFDSLELAKAHFDELIEVTKEIIAIEQGIENS